MKKYKDELYTFLFYIVVVGIAFLIRHFRTEESDMNFLVLILLSSGMVGGVASCGFSCTQVASPNEKIVLQVPRKTLYRKALIHSLGVLPFFALELGYIYVKNGICAMTGACVLIAMAYLIIAFRFSITPWNENRKKIKTVLIFYCILNLILSFLCGAYFGENDQPAAMPFLICCLVLSAIHFSCYLVSIYLAYLNYVKAFIYGT